MEAEIKNDKKVFRCPKCNEVIQYLNFIADIRSIGIVGVDSDGLDWNVRHTDGWSIDEISCPICEAVIFNDEEEVKQFFDIRT